MFAGSWRWCVNDESDVFVGNLRNMLPISSNIYRTWSSQVWFHPFVSRRRESQEPFATSSGIPRRFLASNWKFAKKAVLLFIFLIHSVYIYSFLWIQASTFHWKTRLSLRSVSFGWRHVGLDHHRWWLTWWPPLCPNCQWRSDNRWES